MDDRIGYRPDEAAKAIGIGRSMLFELISSGELDSIKLGRARIIPRQAIEEFIAGRRSAGQRGRLT